MVVEAARATKTGPGEPAIILRADAGLSAAAADLARLSTDDALAIGGDLVTDALNLHGVVQPSPHLLLTSTAAGGEEAMLTDLRRRLPEVLHAGRFRLMGVGVAANGSRQRMVLALLESFVELSPVARSVPVPPVMPGKAMDVPVPISGVMLPPYTRPEVLLTDPAGQVARIAVTSMPVKGDGHASAIRFLGTFHCLTRGRYQIEVAGEDRLGSTVLANFPVYCGAPAPRELSVVHEAPPSRPFTDAADVEGQLLRLLHADRSRAGLPPLMPNPRLAEVARAHSLDMRDHDFLGHVSPRTGDAGDRARRAGIQAPVLLENLARAYSPPEAEKSLMESPGHRANILSKDIDEVGIGVQMKALPGGQRELFVTQLFRRAPEAFDPEHTPQQALSRVQNLRESAHLPAFTVDPELMALAQSTATALSKGRLAEDKVGTPTEAALREMKGRYRLLRTVLAVTTDAKNLGPSPSLLDPASRAIGLSAMPMPNADPKRKLSGAVYVVIILAEPQKPK